MIMNNLEIGKGIWKLKVNMLENIDSISSINSVMDGEKHKHRPPVYNPDYLKSIYKMLTSN